jgi:hypothetical protein
MSFIPPPVDLVKDRVCGEDKDNEILHTYHLNRGKRRGNGCSLSILKSFRFGRVSSQPQLVVVSILYKNYCRIAHCPHGSDYSTSEAPFAQEGAVLASLLLCCLLLCRSSSIKLPTSRIFPSSPAFDQLSTITQDLYILTPQTLELFYNNLCLKSLSEVPCAKETWDRKVVVLPMKGTSRCYPIRRVLTTTVPSCLYSCLYLCILSQSFVCLSLKTRGP